MRGGKSASISGAQGQSRGQGQAQGRGRTQSRLQTTPGGIDFTQAVIVIVRTAGFKCFVMMVITAVMISFQVRTDDGRLCVVREEEVEVLENRPLLACAHRSNNFGRPS